MSLLLVLEGVIAVCEAGRGSWKVSRFGWGVLDSMCAAWLKVGYPHAVLSLRFSIARGVKDGIVQECTAMHREFGP